MENGGVAVVSDLDQRPLELTDHGTFPQNVYGGTFGLPIGNFFDS